MKKAWVWVSKDWIAVLVPCRMWAMWLVGVF